LDALKKLAAHHYRIVIISNQAGVGDGIFSKAALEDINRNMIQAIEAYGARVAGTYYCPHGKKEGCSCRKPKTGLLEQAERDLGSFTKNQTFLIGDKLTDIEAGKSFGLRTIMVMCGYGEREFPAVADRNRPEFTAADLTEAVKIVLEESKRA